MQRWWTWLLALVLLTACSSIGAGGALAEHRGAAPRHEAKPLTTIVLATLPVEDSVPAVIAEEKGFFRQEGLDLKLRLFQVGPAAVTAMVTQSAQFSQSNDTTLIDAYTKHIPLTIVSQATLGIPAFSGVLVLPHSPITSYRDLAGKRIATAVINGIGPLAVDVWLKDHGVDYRTIQWVQMPFQNMGAALEEHQVDAAWVVEPFLTIYEGELHARSLFPVFSGPTQDLPLAAFATSDAYAKAHPAVVAGFARAVAEGERLAAQDPALVRQALRTYTKIPAKVLGRIGLEGYPTSTDVALIQKEADLMTEVGFLKGHVDVAGLIWRGQAP